MPTVLYIRGWRFFFYSDEGNEPIHIHVQKGDSEFDTLRSKDTEIL